MPGSTLSVVRFTDFVANASLPSDESLGYCQPSAKSGLSREDIFVQSRDGSQVKRIAVKERYATVPDSARS